MSHILQSIYTLDSGDTNYSQHSMSSGNCFLTVSQQCFACLGVGPVTIYGSKLSPRLKGSPLQTSRMHARLHATPLLQCTLNPPAPHGSLLSGPRPCDAWSSRTRPCVPISTSLGSAPVPPPCIAAMSSLMALHKLQRKSSSHLCPLSGITGCCHLSFGV